MNEETAMYFYRMGREGCGFITARNILRNARTAQRLAVVACNRELTEREARRAEAVAANIEALARTFGAKAKIDGDPRGDVVTLIQPSGNFVVPV